MAEKSKTIFCETPRCIEAHKKYGENYHGVYDKDVYFNKNPYLTIDPIASCERCGGYTDGKVWEHRCHACGKEVEPGELVGLFVPHSCRACLQYKREQQIKNGQVCLMCRQAYVDCCC